jgi:hypothetical protein
MKKSTCILLQLVITSYMYIKYNTCHTLLNPLQYFLNVTGHNIRTVNSIMVKIIFDRFFLYNIPYHIWHKINTTLSMTGTTLYEL